MNGGKANTPLLDAWRERLRLATWEHGTKTELATYMSETLGQPVSTWKVNISRILGGTLAPGGENLLTITQWMDSRESQPPQKPR